MVPAPNLLHVTRVQSETSGLIRHTCTLPTTGDNQVISEFVKIKLQSCVMSVASRTKLHACAAKTLCRGRGKRFHHCCTGAA